MSQRYQNNQAQYYLQPGEGELPPSDPLQMPANGFDPRFDVDKTALEDDEHQQRGHVLGDIDEARQTAGNSWTEYSSLQDVTNPKKCGKLGKHHERKLRQQALPRGERKEMKQLLWSHMLARRGDIHTLACSHAQLVSPTFAWEAAAVLPGSGGGAGRSVTLRQIKEGVLEADELPALLADVQKLQALRHQHLVALLGVTCCNLTGFDQPHTYALVTERNADSCTLKEFMAKQMSQPSKKLYSDADALRISLQLAKGLRFLHENRRRTWHRNVHPDAILLVGHDPTTMNVKIGDFALDTLITRPTDEKAQALAAKIMPNSDREATPQGLSKEDENFLYLAPEVIKGQPYNEAADVYSLAWLIFELYMRETVYEMAKSRGKVKDLDGFVAEYTLKGLRPGLPSNRIPPRVAETVAACWAAGANARPTVSDVVQQLQDFMMATGVDESGGKMSNFQTEAPKGCGCTIC